MQALVKVKAADRYKASMARSQGVFRAKQMNRRPIAGGTSGGAGGGGGGGGGRYGGDAAAFFGAE